MKISKLGSVISSVYLLFFTVLLVYIFLVLFPNIEFAGLYLILLTLPWSLTLIIATVAMDALGYMDFISLSIKIVCFIIFAVINAIMLYMLGAKIDEQKAGIQ